MKVVIVHTDLRLYWPARLKNLEQMLSAKGHHLSIIEIAGHGSPYAFAIEKSEEIFRHWVCLFPDEKMENISASLATRAVLRYFDKIQPDIVIAGAIAYPSGAGAVRWCKEKEKPVIIFDDARLEDVPRSWLVNYVKRCIYRNVDAVISPAPSQARSFQFWGVASERIFFGLNVVDNEWFAQRAIKKTIDLQRAREQLELPAQFLLGIGRLVEKKNWLRLVECFAELTKLGGNDCWSLVLVGDGPERQKITDYCYMNSVTNVIIKDFVSQEILCQYYSLASALVLPSKFGETWGLVVNEAMASGLPVLVSSQCGCADSLVQDGINGYTFDPESSTALLHVLEKYMGLKKEDQAAMGRDSEAIIRNWSLDRFSQAILKAISHCTDQPKSPPNFFDSIIMKMWKGRYRPT